MSKDGSNFRARRLSVSDIDTSEFEKSKAGGSTPSPSGQRQRRLSLSPEMGQKVARDQVPFPLEIVGTFSCHGVEPGQRQGESNAKTNQDRGGTAFPLDMKYKNINVTEALFTVFDGHGANGDKVSEFVVRRVPELLAMEVELLDQKPASSVPSALKPSIVGGEKGMDIAAETKDGVAQALMSAFVKCDTELQKNRAIDAELSGTTAVAVLVRQYAGEEELHVWTAWAGDSRAVLWTPTKEALAKKSCVESAVADLSNDHKPDTPKETARIKKCGGSISPPEEEWGGPARVWLDAEMTLPGLAMGRSIGDHLVTKVGVTAMPEVTYTKVPMAGDKPAYIVLASDGVWEFISSHQAMQLIAKFISEKSTTAVTKLIETAAAKWRQEEGDYRDDITAICISLHDLVKCPAWSS